MYRFVFFYQKMTKTWAEINNRREAYIQLKVENY